MNSGINQNRSLVNSGPKDTSSRGKQADKYSATIAYNKNNQNIKNNTQNLDTPRSDKIKGSYEGLQHSAQAVINMNGTGYDSVNSQKARYGKKFFSAKDFDVPFESSNFKYKCDIMNNYTSITSSGSSSDRLNRIISRNK